MLSDQSEFFSDFWIFFNLTSPLSGERDLLFLSARRRRILFLVSVWIISKYYLQYAYWPWEIYPLIFFWRFSASLKKSKIAAKILYFMDLFHVWFKGRPYTADVLIRFWCDSDNKNLDFFTLQNFSGYFNFVHFGYHKNLVI